MKKQHIHFMGIGGSGISAAAAIGFSTGLEISGCDLIESPYLEPLRKMGIPIETGHDKNHLKDVDILCVTPAVFWQNKNHEELVLAQKKKIVMTWQEFMGKVLQKNKFVIAVAGVHGKSTTTTLISQLLINAGFDPACEVGAPVPEWGSANFRIGRGRYFVCEADEWNNNFLNYHPDIAIVTSLEMDHPEYFKTLRQMENSFRGFLANLKERGHLILGLDQGAEQFSHAVKNTIAYSVGKTADLMVKELRQEPEGSYFKTKGIVTADFFLKAAGVHNVRNAMAAILTGFLLKIDLATIKKTLAEFAGAGRRLEEKAKIAGVRFFDDYAHHPTAVAATICAARQKFPKNRLWVIFQPHTFSRTKTLLGKFATCFDGADKVLVTDIFASREKPDPAISGKILAGKINHPDVKYGGDIKRTAEYLAKNLIAGDVIINMGAGDNYKITEMAVGILRDYDIAI